MNYCSNCGAAITRAIPPGDNRERYVCNACDTVHYQNPRIVTGCLPVWDNQVLLCRRAIAPREGYWTLPAGYLENGETTAAGAVRETWEEAQATVAVQELYTMFSLPHISQIYLFFRAQMTNPDFAAGEESLEVQLFDEADVPWQELAFPVISQTLEFYFADRIAGTYPMRSRELSFDRKRNPLK